MEIHIKIADDSKANIVLSLLKDLPYVQIKIIKSKNKDNEPNIDELFGLWKDRDISAKELRKQALIESNKEPINILEQKISNKISEVWGEDNAQSF
jgi:hypothetical protein